MNAFLLLAAAAALKVGINLGNPPFQYRDEATGELKGTEIELMKEVAARAGRECVFMVIPFDHFSERIRDGTVDCVVSQLNPTSARRRYLDFSIPYARDGAAFIYRKGETEPTLLNAEAMRVGTIGSTTLDFFLCNHWVHPRRFPGTTEAMAAFEKGEIDAFFFDHGPLEEFAKAAGGRYLVTKLYTRDSYAIAFRKGEKALVEAADAVIAARNGKPEGAK